MIKEHPPFTFFLKTIRWFLLVFIIFAICFKIAESRGWEIAVWMSWETLSTVGYGDFAATTTVGRLLTMIAGTTGIAIMSVAIGAGAVLFTYIEQRRRSGKMVNPYKMGYVVFNFPGTQSALGFITEVRAIESDVGICFVDNIIEELPASVVNMGLVHFVRGSSLDKTTYEQANVCNNKIAIVFPQNPSNPDSDGSTRTVVDLLSKYTKTNDVRILHILVDPQHSWMFCDLPTTEIQQSLELLALVQECQDRYSALIIEHLLKNTEGANQQTVAVDKTEGKTWQQLQISCVMTAGKRGEQINLLAHVRDGVIQTCPKGTEVLQKGDLLSIITFNGFNWSEFEKELV